MSSSWIMGDSTVTNTISFHEALIDFYPSYASSIWNGLDGRPNEVTIIESGFYFLHLHLELFNYTNQAGSPCYAHIIKTAGENNTQTSIASNYLYYPYSQTNNLAQVKWDNRLSIAPLDVISVVYLNSNDTLSTKVQPFSTATGNTTFSFASNNYTFVPTTFSTTSWTRGQTSFITNGIQYSFVNSPYLGINSSFFEIISLKLE